jgi:hypothetical protein
MAVDRDVTSDLRARRARAAALVVADPGARRSCYGVITMSTEPAVIVCGPAPVPPG